MRILLAGASGVLGRATLPHLAGRDVVGLTTSPAKLTTLAELGARGVVCDVYDRAALLRVAHDARPDVVANFVTALAGRSAEANARVRREGGANLCSVAADVGASRLVVESVAFTLSGDAGDAVRELEETTHRFPGDALVLRFGRLWGAGTWHAQRPEAPSVHVERAGAEAARLLLHAPPGTYLVADDA